MRALLMVLALAGSALAGSALAGSGTPPSVAAAEAEVARFPDDYGAWSRLAFASEQAGDPERAAEAWARAAELAPQSVEAALGRARTTLASNADAGSLRAGATRPAARGPG